MNIICCHGVMSPEQDWNTRTYNELKGWKNWLQFYAELKHDVLVQLPRFPHAHAALMKYSEWEKIMDSQDINEDTVLIGHSAGGGFVLKYMSLHPEIKVKQIVLVAPWLDIENFQPFGFYKGTDLTKDIVSQTKLGVDLMYSSDDDSYILSSCDAIIKNMPKVNVHKFADRGHFVTPQLPEIMQIIKF